ncbi:acetyltransferase [Bizionia gelidisalsuginis]|uniref:Acetyltransferase n=1 Tax=Bizionia gelidisalsuginis TaxID=291188 RepID=A0ABY3M7D9_9FLAO|nr:acetyltransferase [Bizionia gelidisalsuginis]TYC08812.1 acetyltransferase [Bizionia gelidisalsuginis]
MKKVILVGTGGHTAEVVEYIKYHNRLKPYELIEILGFIDENDKLYRHYEFTQPYLGIVENHKIRLDVHYMFCFGNMVYKEKLVTEFKTQNAKFLTFIHPTALIAETCKIGEGVLISHNASVGPMAVVGDFNILNSRCTIGHDTILGDFNFISPQVSLSGNTTVGHHNMFGVNSATIPGVSLGNNNTIGAGSIITKDIEVNSIVVGVPGVVIKIKKV